MSTQYSLIVETRSDTTDYTIDKLLFPLNETDVVKEKPFHESSDFRLHLRKIKKQVDGRHAQN